VQESLAALKRQPAVWNEVWSSPPNTEPNGALPGTIIQNWHTATSGATTTAGFQTLVSTYSQFYLDTQCCLAGEAGAASGPKTSQCYWTDISSGVAPGQMNLLLGGGACLPIACALASVV
jgi:hypothetical protein